MVLGLLNHWEIIAIVAVGVLLFGSRLPSIARSLGKSITEFKKGVKDLKDDVDPDKEPRQLDKGESRELPAEKIEKEESKHEQVSG